MPSESKKLQWICNFDYQEWEGMEVTWQSPLACMVAMGSPIANQVVAIPQTARMPILELAARSAFWEFGLTQLQRLAEWLGCLQKDADLCGSLAALIRHVLPNLPEGDLVHILEQRLIVDEAEFVASQMLENEFVADHLDKQDGQDAKIMSEDKGAKEAQRVTFRRELATLRTTIQTNANADPTGASKRRKRAAGVQAGPRALKKYSMDDDYSFQEYVKMLPVGARLYQDNFNNRFVCWYKGMSLSRSWPLAGAQKALHECCQWAWGQAVGFGEICPYKGLLTGS